MKVINAKLVWSLLLFSLLNFLCGCMTSTTVARAKGQHETWFGSKIGTYKHPADGEPHPDYYWLLPLTIPADIATSPIQIVWIPVAILLGGNGM